MAELVQVKAEIPRELKRRTFAAFALREEKFARWLRSQMEAYANQTEDAGGEPKNAGLARSQARG